MKNLLPWVLVIGLVCLPGCGTMILKRPYIQEVKKLAIVSVYANTEIHSVEATPVPKGGDLFKATTGITLGENTAEAKELAKVVSYGLETFHTALSGVGAWEVIPTQEVLAHGQLMPAKPSTDPSAFGRFLSSLGNDDSAWVTAPGLLHIPVSGVVDSGSPSIQLFGSTPSPHEVRQNLAELCKRLHVDAVAVIELDLAYKNRVFSGVSVDGIMDFRGTATPVVSANIVVVTKDAQLAVENYTDGRGVPPVESFAAPLLKNNVAELTDPKGEAERSFRDGIQRYATAVKEKITAELAGK